MLEVPPIPGVVIERELGHGAYSVVYRGRLEGAPCALKLPYVRGSWTRWVYREAVALARVRHPGLPAILEVGEVDGLPYLAMELVEGETLAEALAAGAALAEARVLELGIDLVRTLAAVHDAGLIHRDVKPANLVLDASGRIRLVDFGFATAIERLGGDAGAAGTPAYAAPEQLVDPARVDARADLYAVGRVLLECATGDRHHDEHAEALVARSLSPGLATVIAGLVARDPDARYPDARAVRADLERVQARTAPLGAAGSTTTPRVRPFVGRGPELAHLLAATAPATRGVGSVVTVRGERGSGKSTLLAAARERWSATATAVTTGCRDGDAPLASLRRILEGCCTSLGTDTPDAALRAAIGDDLAPLATLIAPSLGGLLGSEDPRAQISAGTFAEGAAELLVRIARHRGPLLVAVDDMQWADPISEEVLRCLAHRAHEAPLALVLSSRTGRARPESLDRVLDGAIPGVVSMELPSLDRQTIGELVATHLGEDEPDDDVLRRIAALSDHTPLGVLEVLGALLDRGALRPHRGRWRLDRGKADGIALPEGTAGLVGRRVAELPPAAVVVLEVAALLGAHFASAQVGSVLGLAASDVDFGLADARRAGLVEWLGADHRFVHDTVREILVQGLSTERRRSLHQRIAEVLDDEPNPTFDVLCAKAAHYAEGERDKDPDRALSAARAAAAASIERFDNETGLRYLRLAEEAAALAGASLSVADLRGMGEAHLRLGTIDASLRAFAAALDGTSDRLERAEILGRIAWVHQTAGEPERSWSTLERAFLAIEQRMPREDVASAMTTARHVLARGVRVVSRAVSSERRAPLAKNDGGATALLCDLHYQNARLALEHGKPLRLLESALQAMDLGERAGAARAHAGARAMIGVVLTAIGQSEAGAASVAQAAELARAARDPVTEAFCVQIRSVLACMSGDFDEGLRLTRECVEVHGHWLELTELCLDAANGHYVNTLRGRPREALAAITRASERLSRSPRVADALASFVECRARAARVTLGTDAPPRSGGADALSAASGLLHLGSWGSRMLLHLERDDLGPELEDLVRAFETERHNPRTAHLVLVEYYVAVAHARVEQCLQAGAAERRARIAVLRRAVADLRACSKLALFKAHLELASAHLAWFEGKTSAAWHGLDRAERIASEQSCPWVLHGVARARAHWLRETGHHAAALDHARVAYVLAREHGAASRAARVAREFGLAPTSTVATPSLRSTSSHRSHRAQRQLAALLQIAKAGGTVLRSEAQGEAVLAELRRAVDAERATLWFQPDPAIHTRLVLGRTRRGDSSFEVDGWRHDLLTIVREDGEAWPATSGDRGRFAEPGIDPDRVLALPLLLYGRTVGAVSLERPSDAPAFSSDDRELLVMLAQQVPLALEIGRLLGEREQLQASLQQAQKMEAVGQLAGGVAHDFNNMLTAIQGSLDAVAERVQDDPDSLAELAVAVDATDRAAQLTRQLLTFSRHQPVPLGVCDPNEMLTAIQPMLRRLVGSRVSVVLELEPTARAVKADRAAFEQALVNLAVNARDAMPAGGTLTISTRNVILGELHVRRGASPGDHVTIAVSDAGQGMSPEILSRIFEPFFTTKGVGTGTGLGLTMVYAFVKNCGGHIEVQSERGAGTTFLLHLPRATAQRAQSLPPPASPPTSPEQAPTPPRPARRGTETVLVIDDDRLVSRAVQKMLERSGYRVLLAHSADHALSLVSDRAQDIALVILDMVMPGMSGPELGRRLADLQLPAKLLYVSGYAPESLPESTEAIERTSFLQKPFAPSDLLDRVGRLLDS